MNSRHVIGLDSWFDEARGEVVVLAGETILGDVQNVPRIAWSWLMVDKARKAL